MSDLCIPSYSRLSSVDRRIRSIQELYDYINKLDPEISKIEELIPSEASESNKLADKVWVDQSIGDAQMGQYLGAVNIVSDLGLDVDASEAQVATALATEFPEAGNRDSCLIQIPSSDSDPEDIVRADTYEYNGEEWLFKFTIDDTGIIDAIAASGLVYDISAANSGATYADLTAALGTNGANIPEGIRKGGMSVKFVLTYDNKYVQFRYMDTDAITNATFTNVANWQGVESSPTLNSKNLVESGGMADTLGIVPVKNGSVGNPSNKQLVSTKVIATHGCKYITVSTNRPVSSNCKYVLGYKTTTSTNDIGRTDQAANWEGRNRDQEPTTAAISFTVKMESNEVGIAFVLGEMNSDGTYNTLRVTSFVGYEVKVIPSNFLDRTNLERALSQVALVQYSLGEFPTLDYRLKNGSQGNSFNAWVVTMYGSSTNAIPVKAGQRIAVSILKEPEEGFHYYYRYITYSTDNPSTLTSSMVRNNTGNTYSLDEAIEIEEGELGITIQLTELKTKTSGQSAGNCIALRIVSFIKEELRLIAGSNLVNVPTLENRVDAAERDLTKIISPDVVTRNGDKLPMLSASCRYRKSSNTSKDFQLLIVTDSHGDSICVGNSVKAANGFDLVDALIHCGDVADNISLNLNIDTLWKNIAANCAKPYYFVIGNHESGTYTPVSTSPSQEQLYNSFIKPSVDAGHLVSGEYTSGKCYYYHDFTTLKVRLIVINEYEAPRIPDTTAYWKPITYNSSLPNYANNTAYTAGTQVNVNGYTDYSFEAVSDFNSGGYYDFKSPAVKYRLGYRWISQSQAQWFLDTLASTPSGYKIVVACHNPFSDHADVVQNVAFSQKNGWVDGYGIQNYMTNDFIADAINAYQTKSNFSTTCASQYPDDMPSYSVSKNFANVVGTFHSLIGGHVHQDCVWKHQTYNQYQVTPICANTTNYQECPTADIRRPNSSVINELDTDCLTIVSFRPNQLGLVKLGVNVTETGEKRDYEVIDISGN